MNINRLKKEFPRGFKLRAFLKWAETQPIKDPGVFLQRHLLLCNVVRGRGDWFSYGMSVGAAKASGLDADSIGNLPPKTTYGNKIGGLTFANLSDSGFRKSVFK